MFWTKRVVIGDGERGLVYRNRQFLRVLTAGVYRWFDPFERIEVRTFAIAAPEYAGHDVDALVAQPLRPLPPLVAMPPFAGTTAPAPGAGNDRQAGTPFSTAVP